MKEYAAGIESAALKLVEIKPAPDGASESLAAGAPSSADKSIHHGGATQSPGSFAPPRDEAGRPGIKTTDRYMTQAIEEHAAGHIDRTLWERALAQAGGDNAQAKSIYLRSRATALRVRKREKRAARYAGVVESLSAAPDTGFEPPAANAGAASAPSDASKVRRSFTMRNRVRAAMAAAVFVVLGLMVILVTGVVVLPWGRDTSGHELTAVTTPRLKGFGGAKASSPAPSAPAVPAAAQSSSAEDFIAKLPALKKEGNWNLFVIYAVEWTRRQPTSADAWKELSQGYLKLRQYGEAQDAATKATQLSPDDYLQWQNLGQINVAVQAPMEGLKAFEHAVMLNDRDVVSLVGAGQIYVQSGRVPEARAAFDKALAVNAQEAQALCGAASVAQREGRAKDAIEMRRQAASVGERCSDAGGNSSVRVATDELPRGKPSP